MIDYSPFIDNHPCKYCKADPGDPCVYVDTHKNKHRVGQPTQRPHFHRFWAENGKRVAVGKYGGSLVTATPKLREDDRASARWVKDNIHLFEELTHDENL